MSSLKLLGLALAFFVDLVAAVALVLLHGGGHSADAALGLAVGRLLGLLLLSVLAVRLALGRWPHCSLRCSRPSVPETSRELMTVRSPGPGRLPLLEEPDVEADRPQQPQTPQVQLDGDARAQQISASVAEQKEILQKLERGGLWRNGLLFMSYIYISFCSMWTAVVLVGIDFSVGAHVPLASAHIACIIMMNFEFLLLKSLVMETTSGKPVYMTAVHEHPLFWKDLEGKGVANCSTCSEKIGAKTGGYLVLQCRLCAPSKWGFGGFQTCMHCYRKNAAKSSEAGNTASGTGILRGDRGPKVQRKMSVFQYVRRLTSMVRRGTMVFMVVSVCGSQFLSTYIPKAQGDCISALVKANREEFDKLILRFAVLVVVSAVMSFAMSVAVGVLSTRLQSDMACALFKSLLNQDIAFYDNAMTGQLNSRLTNDLRQAVSPVSIIINSFMANIIMLLTGFVICFQSSWRLTILAFTFLAPMVHITAEFSKWAAQLMATQWTYMADAQGSATQALTNIRTVHSFWAQDIELEQYSGHVYRGMRVGVKSAWGMGGANLLSGLVQQGASFIILYYGGYLALDHRGFDVGSIITFTYLWNKLSNAFRGLNENLNAPVKAMSAGQRVFEVMDLRPDITSDGGQSFPDSREQVELTLHDVKFNYQNRPDKKVLEGVSLRIAAGQTTAVVGKSGCGKSTISKLLLRFYDPTEGKVFLNSVDLRQMDLSGLRNHIGVVSQDTQLFRTSVLENITYGLRPGSFSTADVERAAALANAVEFIQPLPEGYKTMIGEGGHDLSGGQRQRLSIARALVRRPRLLLLDEATSALDAENEAQVQQALDSLMREMQGTCTIMVIAHRLSTIKDANRIIVLHEGKVVEEGTHEELIQIREGRYATMIARQLSGNQAAEEDGAPNEEKQVRDTEKEVIRLIELLPDEKRGEVLMAMMKKFKSAMMKGKGAGR